MEDQAGRSQGHGRVRRVLLGAAFAGYPVLVWFGLTAWSARAVAVVLLAALLPVAAAQWWRPGRATVRSLAAVPLVTVLALVLGAVLDSAGFVLAVPVAINVLLLIVFGTTLRAGAIPMIERFARLVEPDLSPEKQHWCRLWTGIWCAFFITNGAIALGLALAAPLAWWAVYNGLIAYALIGILFAAEWIGRRRRFGRTAPTNLP